MGARGYGICKRALGVPGKASLPLKKNEVDYYQEMVFVALEDF